MSTRRQFLQGSAVAVGGAAMATVVAGSAGRDEASGTARRPPNIILILHDDLGHAETEPYGQKIIKTPNIERLANEGLRFTTYYGGACVCAPSRSVALTGLHGGHTTVRQNPEQGVSMSLHDSDVTFAEVLRTRGYRTGHFGKWGFGPTVGDQPSHPNNRGFEEFFGYITHHEAHNYYPTHLWHNSERVVLDGRTYAPPLFVEQAIDFINAHAQDPFLVYLAPNLPHAPSAVPSTVPYLDPAWTAPDRGHAAQVSMLDRHVGMVVDAVERLGLRDDTFVMVTSDHGPHEEHGVDPYFFASNRGTRGLKRNLYEGGIRVPFIAWGPSGVPVGTTDAQVGHVDLLPTLAELAGTVRPTDLDGHSFASLLTGTGTAAPERDHFYWYRRDPYNTRRAAQAEGGKVTRVAEAIRRGDWKLVRIAKGHERPASARDYPVVQLFDLATDPGETADVAAAHPDVVGRLTGLLDADWAEPYRRRPYGVAIRTGGEFQNGRPFTVTVTFSNGTAVPLRLTELRLEASPAGAHVVAVAKQRPAQIRVGGSVTASYQVTVPDGVAAPSLTATATLKDKDGNELHFLGMESLQPPMSVFEPVPGEPDPLD